MGTGNTRSQKSREIKQPVHPRGHGEHLIFLPSAIISTGSSPWARGTRSRTGSASTFSTVHPRGHGEHNCPTCGDSHNCGSSPWARGTHKGRSNREVMQRFIPVGTGNTLATVLLLLIVAVHPRGHGEHFRGEFDAFLDDGSSPWARGTQAISKAVSNINRFIPVGTGNTRFFSHRA